MIDNYGKKEQSITVEFAVLPLRGDNVIFTENRKVIVKSGEWKKIEVEWNPKQLNLDFYRFKVILNLNDRVIDTQENGFVVWNEKTIQGETAFNLKFQDNYFHDGNRPLFLMGCRDSGIHYHAHEDPLDWV